MIATPKPPEPLYVVIHTSFGGFHLTSEMARWLRDEKGWKLGTSAEWDNPEVDLIASPGTNPSYYGRGDNDSFGFRSHPELIECVRHFHAKYQDASFKDRRYDEDVRTTLSLRVIEITFMIEIEDVHDGKEEIRVSAAQTSV